MCKPVITQLGFIGPLSLWCEEHKSNEPVLYKGERVYSIDVLTYLDMLIEHRKKYEKEE